MITHPYFGFMLQKWITECSVHYNFQLFSIGMYIIIIGMAELQLHSKEPNTLQEFYRGLTIDADTVDASLQKYLYDFYDTITSVGLNTYIYV